MFVVTASNRLLFGTIDLFHKCGRRQLNLSFANSFLHNDLFNVFLDLAVYLLVGFTIKMCLKIHGVSILTEAHKVECLKFTINLFK